MDYVDAVPLFDAALRDLQGTALLVRDERYPMLELMSAIEINDPRTDTFLHARQQLPTSGEFDPALQLEYSDSEVLDISNHLLQLEATFQAGHPLASTLWTCNLLRLSSLSTLALSSSGTNTVLRALLLGTLKCSEIVHQELSKGQVYEHEDVHLSLPPSMSFSSLLSSAYPRPPRSSRRRRHPPVPVPVPEQEQRSPLLVPGQQHHHDHQQRQVFDDAGRGYADRPESDSAASDVVAAEPSGEEVEEEGEEQPRPEITTDDVLRALDEALTALDADAKAEADEGLRDGSRESQDDGEEEVQEEERRVRSKLRDMVMFRISFLYVLALMTSPHRASPDDILLHLAHLRSSLSTLLPSASAPPPSSPTTPTSAPPPPPLSSSRMQAIFLPSRKVPLLPTQQPPRPVSPLSFPRAIKQTRELCDDLEELVLLCQAWDQDDDEGVDWRWTRLEEWARGRGRKGARAVPYMRSLQQSVIVPSPTAPLFGSHPHLSLVQAFLASSLPVSSSFTSRLLPTLLHSLSFLRLRQSSNLAASSPAHRVLSYFEQDLARDFLLRNTVHSSGQNRARQRRWTVKQLLLNNENDEGGVGRGGGIDEVLRPAWREVLPTLLEGDEPTMTTTTDDEDDDRGAPQHSSKWLGPLTSQQRDLLIRFPDLLATALHRQSTLWALEAHLSGFETSMQLFESVEEKCQAWWAAERVALSIGREIEASLEREREREVAAAMMDREEAGRGNFALRDQLDEVHAIATLCRSSRKLASLGPGTVATAPKFSSPFLPGLAVPPHDAARGRFRQPFEWLNVLRRRRDEPELVFFEAYEAAQQTDDDPNELREALAALARRIDRAQTEAKRTTVSPTMRDLCQVAQLHLEEWSSRRGSEQPNGHGTRIDSSLSGPLSWFALSTTSS